MNRDSGKERNRKDCDPKLIEEFVQDFGRAYRRFGLPTLMGNIVGLLLCSPEPLSLDQITEQLGVSKGPVSQVMGRLRDHELVVRTRRPGNRKDYYEAVDDIFGKAFANHRDKLGRNLVLAETYRSKLESRPETPEHFRGRIDEMERFYALMMEHLDRFLDEWDRQRSSKK